MVITCTPVHHKAPVHRKARVPDSTANRHQAKRPRRARSSEVLSFSSKIPMDSRKYLEVLRQDPHELQDGPTAARLLAQVREIVSSHPSEHVRETALAIIEVFEELYPLDERDKHNLSDDGSFTRCHPLALAYRCAMAGADVDAILAALLHDVIEDNKIASARELGDRIHQIGLAPYHAGLVQSVWETVELVTQEIPKSSRLYRYKKRLREELDSPLKLPDERRMRMAGFARSKYSDYVERIYRSTSITAMQLKEYDTMHNVQRAILLGPEKSFYKIYSIITKALTHIDLSKKACYPIAAETLRALQALWGNLEDWMSQNGIPMNPVLASIRTEVHSHRDEMSDSQKAALSDGVAVTDARAEFNSQTAKYGRLRAAELWCPDSRNWLKTARVGGALPELKIEVEFPLYIFLKDEPWDFLAERFEQISKEEAVAVASSIFASYHLSFREQPSYLFPVFHDEQVIFQIDLPIRLVDEAQYLVSHNALESPGFSQRERRARIEYNSFIERVAAAAREAFHKMESMTRA